MNIHNGAGKWLTFSLSLGAALAQAKEQPNLLVIITDEHNLRTLGCYRDQLAQDQAEIWGKDNVVETPNIDKLASWGTLFDRMYCSAPVSTTARASMFTGYYGHEVHVPKNSTKPGDGRYLRGDVKTIAEVLLDAGYSTGYTGKWHLAEATEPHEFWQPHPVGMEGHNYGFEDNRFMFNGGHGKYLGLDKQGNPYFAFKQPKAYSTDKYGQPLYKDKKGDQVKFTTDFLTDRTVEFIDKNAENPFFYVVSIPDPHTPDQVRAPYDTMYTHMSFEFPATYNIKMGEDAPSWQKPDGKAKKLMTSLPQYFGMVKNIDDNIGRIITKLENEGILENTIIVFTSDHGDLLGEHARMNKGTIHETSLRVPFIIAHGSKASKPLVPRDNVVDLVGNTTDWMPTFLELLGVDSPQASGRSLVPILSNKAPKGWNNVTFSQLGFSVATDGRYKLRVSPYQEKPWLIDLKEDPTETINFIDDPKYKDVVQNLAQNLVTYNKEHNKSNEKVAAVLQSLLQ